MANKEQKTKIQVEIYDELIEVNVVKGEEEKYCNAAKFVTERLETYIKRYEGTKGLYRISLMTMLDIALNPMPDYNSNKKSISIWSRMIDHINFLKK